MGQYKIVTSVDRSSLGLAVAGLDLTEVQFVLYQCSEEGRETGFAAYNVPGLGDLNYCGLAGLVPVLDRMRADNNLGHPLASNLRAGDWLMDYITARLRQFQHQHDDDDDDNDGDFYDDDYDDDDDIYDDDDDENDDDDDVDASDDFYDDDDDDDDDYGDYDDAGTNSPGWSRGPAAWPSPPG